MEDSNNNNYDIRNLILGALEETVNVKFIEKCYFIYEATEMKKESKKILDILNNDELLRNIKRIDAITEDNENKIFYYEQDNKSPKKLSYYQELEEAMRSFRNEQLSTLAKLLSKLNNEEEIELG